MGRYEGQLLFWGMIMISTSRVSNATKQPLLRSDASSLKNLSFICSDPSSSSAIESCRRLGLTHARTHTHTHTHTHAHAQAHTHGYVRAGTVVSQADYNKTQEKLLCFPSCETQNHIDFEPVYVHSFKITVTLYPMV